MVTSIGEDRRVTEPRPTVPALLARSLREFGSQAYVITPTDRLTYEEAAARSAHVARRLLHEGVGKGTRVGIFFANGVDWIVWWLAVSRIGALAVPLSTLYAPVELAKVLRLADIALLVAPHRVLNIDVAERFEAAIPELTSQSGSRLTLAAAPYLRRIVLTTDTDRRWATRWTGDADALVPEHILSAAEEQVSPADPAVMIHTSGSTADPKGVVHTHGTLVRQTSTWPSAIRAVTGSGSSAAILCAMPFFWVGGLLATTGALHENVTLLVLPRLDASAALDLIERERATGIVGWPAFTQRLREHPSFAGRDLSSARMLREGPLDIAMTDVPDGFPVHRTMSETAGGFAFTELRIVDDDGQPVTDGTVGELHIRGIGVMAGYNKRERWETFDADGWYHTGDLASLDSRGYLRIEGRIKDMIIRGGENIYPREIEDVLFGHPAVAEAVVIGVPDERWGEVVAAYVRPAPVNPGQPAPSAGELRAYCRERLAPYKTPQHWVFVDAFPMTPSGKIQKYKLRGSFTASSGS
jgi:acyl-CoA synthetase (AMP-forming)/AMP-acid ligase II